MEYGEVEKIVEEKLRSGSYHEAIELIDTQISENEDKKKIAKLLILKARIFILYFSDQEKFMESVNLALNLIEDIEDKSFKAEIFNSAAGLLLYIGDDYNALKYYEKALENLNESELLYLRVLNNIGEAYKRRNELEMALKFFLKDYELGEKYGEKRILVYVAENIGEVYALKGEWKKALEWIEKAYKIAKEIGEDRMIHYMDLINAIKEGNREKMENLEKIMRKRGELHEIADAFFYFHPIASPEFQEELLNKAALLFAEIKDGKMHNASLERLEKLKKK